MGAVPIEYSNGIHSQNKQEMDIWHKLWHNFYLHIVSMLQIASLQDMM